MLHGRHSDGGYHLGHSVTVNARWLQIFSLVTFDKN